MMTERVIVIVGPTAVGKTALSIAVAKRFNGEVISGDSLQVYRTLDIGTAKVTTEEMDGVPHHLIDICEPDEPFTAYDFQQAARQAIADITSRGKVPVICGGTGLYIQAALYDYQFNEQKADETVRLRLEQELATVGIDAMYARLVAVDPERAASIHPNNTRRLIRALELYETTGEKMSARVNALDFPLYAPLYIGLDMERETLYERINRRVDLMVEQGLFDEVRGLYESGLRDAQSIQGIGYKELYDYFDGRVSVEAAIEQLKQNSRRYAKRQLTWFRNQLPISWFNVSIDTIQQVREEIFAYLEENMK